MRLTASSTREEWPCAVSTTMHVDAGVDQELGALEAALADRGRGRRRAAGPARPCRPAGWATAFSMSLTVIRPTQRY